MSLISVLTPFSYGQVAESNPTQSRTIKIKVLEHLPSAYGVPNNEVDTVVKDIPTLDSMSYTASSGVVRKPKMKTVRCEFKDWVSANWLNRSANVISPPKVVVGQRVMIWRVGDSNQYYWEELDVDMRLKQDEHIVIAINNNNKGKTLDLDNAYIIEYSTRDKRVRVRTNRNSDEKAAYEVDINGGKGFLKIMDDCAGTKEDYQGNGVLIDSVNTIVKMQNIDDTHYIMDKEDIFVHCKGNRTSKIGGLDKTTAGNIENYTNNYLTKATSITEQASKITEIGDNIIMSSPTILAGGGSMKISAALSIGGPAAPAAMGPAALSASKGSVEIDGVITVIGESTFMNSVTFKKNVTFLAPVTGTAATWSVSCSYP